MNEKKLNELLQLYVLDELNDSDKAELEKHLENSEQARFELEKVQSLFRKFSLNKPEEMNDDLLLTSRQNLLFPGIMKANRLRSLTAAVPLEETGLTSFFTLTKKPWNGDSNTWM